MSITFEQAGKILKSHDMAFRASSTQGHIDALLIWVDRAGNKGETWEAVQLTVTAIREWIGY